MSTALVVHLVATCAMLGFAWTIQLLQYPGMADVPSQAFPRYERNHQRRVSRVLLLFAPMEVVTGAWIVAEQPGDPVRWTAGALLALIWISTAFWFAPLHGRLAAGFDPHVHARLITTNWARTAGWTVRALLVAALVV